MKVVISELMWPEGIARLNEEVVVVYQPSLWQERERLIKEVADAEALIVRNQTEVDRHLLQAARRLQVVGRLGVGLDNIDLPAADEAGVMVVYAKNANATAVAEYVLAAMLSVCRPVLEASASVKRGEWDRRRYTGRELYGQTLGLIGLGEIGLRISVRAKALGLTVLGYDPWVGPYDFPYAEVGVKPVSWEELLSRSDILSLHVPLNSATRHMLSHAEFSRMKSTVTLINASRGGVVDEAALCSFLQQQPEARAVLDVLENEPPEPNHPLLSLDNVILTPHVAGLTEQAQKRISILIAEEVLKVLKGQPSQCAVN